MKANKGDLITVQVDQVKEQYRETGDYTKISIDSVETTDAFGGLEQLSNTHIYRIEKDDLHEDLEKQGIKVGHFTLKAIKVETLAFPNPGEVKVNGEYDIPFKTSRRTRLADTYYFDELVARSIATGLNMTELDKLNELAEVVKSGQTMLNQILEKAHV